jgi:FMN phosphatase YigB (HAD superfamily)
MRRFLVFDLGETLLNFRKQHRWYDSLKNDAIPLMYNALSAKSSPNTFLLPAYTDFEQVVYAVIAKQNPQEKSMSMMRRIQEYFKVLKLPMQSHLLQAQMDAFFATFIPDAQLYEDTLDVLTDLQHQQYQLGLLSNTPWQCPGSLMDRLLQHFQILRYFSTRIYSGDWEISKPDPRTLQIVMEKANEKRENMIYIGNNSQDVEVAHRFGIPSVWINRLKENPTDFLFSPSFEIHSLKELLGLIPFE